MTCVWCMAPSTIQDTPTPSSSRSPWKGGSQPDVQAMAGQGSWLELGEFGMRVARAAGTMLNADQFLWQGSAYRSGPQPQSLWPGSQPEHWMGPWGTHLPSGSTGHRIGGFGP